MKGRDQQSKEKKLILLKNVENVFTKIQNNNDLNPSLYLDKFTGALEQKEAKEALRKIINLTGYYKPSSRQQILKALPGYSQKKFEAQTPFTIHLSRAIALENTGICFHPIYGFVYIPGSGIKGLARAYANLISADKDLILEIFGNENDEKDSNKLKAGKVVFHDAFPELDGSYKLNIEINNCHHMEYYEGKGEPGDWENPNPTYFLSVKPGVKFNFALSLRQDINPEGEFEINGQKSKNKDLINKAWEFIAGGVAHLGLGAKTNAGFGYFKSELDVNLSSSDIISKEYEIELQTPAFLANAFQGEDDCYLTVKTLKGQLRWWWRTIYYGKISNADLLKLESSIWGSTENASPISILIEKIGNQNPIGAYGKSMGTNRSGNPILKNDKNFIEKNSLTTFNINGAPILPFNYLSYGMNEYFSKEDRWVRRYILEPGVKWKIKVKVKKSKFNNIDISKEDILANFEYSFYLLSNYGGVGAKTNKGFGSFKVLSEMKKYDIDMVKNERLSFIKRLKINPIKNYNYFFSSIDSSQYKEKIITAQNIYQVINLIGKKYLKFANLNKHKYDKKAMGLPRKIHGPHPHPIGNQRNHQRPQNLTPDINTPTYKYMQNKKLEVKDIRHPSPIHFHIEKFGNDRYKVNIIVFSHRAITNTTTIINNFFSEF